MRVSSLPVVQERSQTRVASAFRPVLLQSLKAFPMDVNISGGRAGTIRELGHRLVHGSGFGEYGSRTRPRLLVQRTGAIGRLHGRGEELKAVTTRFEQDSTAFSRSICCRRTYHESTVPR